MWPAKMDGSGYYCNSCFLLFHKKYYLVPLDKIKETFKCPHCGEPFHMIHMKRKKSIVKVIIDDGIDPKWNEKKIK